MPFSLKIALEEVTNMELRLIPYKANNQAQPCQGLEPRFLNALLG